MNQIQKKIEKHILCESCGEIMGDEMISQRQFIKECGKEALKTLIEDGYFEGEDGESDYSYKKDGK
jgi:hypothetical protein